MTDLAIKPLMAGQLRALLSRVLSPGSEAEVAEAKDMPRPAFPSSVQVRDMAFDDQIYREIFPAGDPAVDAAGSLWLTD